MRVGFFSYKGGVGRTKVMVGTAALMLIDDNLLEFDDPVAKWLPSFDAEGFSLDLEVHHPGRGWITETIRDPDFGSFLERCAATIALGDCGA